MCHPICDHCVESGNNCYLPDFRHISPTEFQSLQKLNLERDAPMEHFYERDYAHDATPIFAGDWTDGDTANPGEFQTAIRYRKTRSTLAVDAYDIFDLEDEYAVAAFKALVRLCKMLGREEIIIECLDILPTDETNRSINDCVNSLQSGITRTCRNMNLYPPRVSLEKRGQHFDLRIYPTFH